MKPPYSQPDEIPQAEVVVGLDEFDNAIRKFGVRNAVEYFGYPNGCEFEQELIDCLLERSK